MISLITTWASLAAKPSSGHIRRRMVQRCGSKTARTFSWTLWVPMDRGGSKLGRTPFLRKPEKDHKPIRDLISTGKSPYCHVERQIRFLSLFVGRKCWAAANWRFPTAKHLNQQVTGAIKSTLCCQVQKVAARCDSQGITGYTSKRWFL